MTFADKLKSLRTLAGESQKHLASVLVISDVMISNNENGRKMPGRERRKELQIIQYNLADLLGESKNEVSDTMIILNRGQKNDT
jgi:transcriptional regulator with XRE-family HTH domain